MMTYPINSPVHGWDENKESVNASTRGEKKEVGEITMVQVSNTIVNPGAMVVHFQTTSTNSQRTNFWISKQPNKEAGMVRQQGSYSLRSMKFKTFLRLFKTLLSQI